MILETLTHEASSFVTLTYDDEHLPEGGNLYPRDTQLFFKRLRKKLDPIKLRYYLVGEYGDRTQRPHYHIALFGVPMSAYQTIADAWPYGMIDVGSLTFESAAYIAGYVTKKMTAKDDPRLEGRHPEFARMSTNPGIGGKAMDDLANVMMTKHGSKMLAELGDVPTVLKHGGKSMPLGRYLRRKLREKLDIPEMGFDSPACQKQREELQDVFDHSELPAYLKNAPSSLKQRYYSHILASRNKGKIRSIETKFKIFQKDKPL